MRGREEGRQGRQVKQFGSCRVKESGAESTRTLLGGVVGRLLVCFQWRWRERLMLKQKMG